MNIKKINFFFIVLLVNLCYIRANEESDDESSTDLQGPSQDDLNQFVEFMTSTLEGFVKNIFNLMKVVEKSSKSVINSHDHNGQKSEFESDEQDFEENSNQEHDSSMEKPISTRSGQHKKKETWQHSPEDLTKDYESNPSNSNFNFYKLIRSKSHQSKSNLKNYLSNYGEKKSKDSDAFNPHKSHHRKSVKWSNRSPHTRSAVRRPSDIDEATQSTSSHNSSPLTNPIGFFGDVMSKFTSAIPGVHTRSGIRNLKSQSNDKKNNNDELEKLGDYLYKYFSKETKLIAEILQKGRSDFFLSILKLIDNYINGKVDLSKIEWSDILVNSNTKIISDKSPHDNFENENNLKKSINHNPNQPNEHEFELEPSEEEKNQQQTDIEHD